MNSLNRLFAGELREKTLILISHRLSTVTGVDYIYLINQGKVEESGTHEELMGRQGHPQSRSGQAPIHSDRISATFLTSCSWPVGYKPRIFSTGTFCNML